MAHYLVRARLKPELRAELRSRLEAGEFRSMRPFGETLNRALLQARQDLVTGETVWEELCYCSPPLAEERAAVLDRYFEGLTTETVPQGGGWHRISALPLLWKGS